MVLGLSEIKRCVHPVNQELVVPRVVDILKRLYVLERVHCDNNDVGRKAMYYSARPMYSFHSIQTPVGAKTDGCRRET